MFEPKVPYIEYEYLKKKVYYLQNDVDFLKKQLNNQGKKISALLKHLNLEVGLQPQQYKVREKKNE